MYECAHAYFYILYVTYTVRLISPTGCKVCMYCGGSLKRKIFDGKRIVVTMRGTLCMFMSCINPKMYH